MRTKLFAELASQDIPSENSPIQLRSPSLKNQKNLDIKILIITPGCLFEAFQRKFQTFYYTPSDY